ncbi:hypothetical protein CROQUDRAFT_710782 [Cronartium quercuum f. sp. fusiforme G11]|uniref:Uncharacterized protein n=1 Tax=Cronartium quercuum f. sp. fusiforme G11 TaxID=708437 RepID=A0A9P6NI42_9BASI|nr:hypothetical protein CROQUDRAFT_710782 [Cronartium quercuum f. sp. fusiforme G11]
MSTTEVKDTVQQPSFKKLSSPHSDSNWTFWDYHMMTLLDGKNLSYLVTGKTKMGYDLDKKRIPDDVIENDEAAASSYISERVEDDNVALLIAHRGDPRKMYEALKEVHQNKPAGNGPTISGAMFLMRRRKNIGRRHLCHCPNVISTFQLVPRHPDT